jgi:hypothetical protein
VPRSNGGKKNISPVVLSRQSNYASTYLIGFLLALLAVTRVGSLSFIDTIDLVGELLLVEELLVDLIANRISTGAH